MPRAAENLAVALESRRAPTTHPVPRRVDIDALRVMAVLLLVYFHTGMVFNLWPFHIKNDQLSRGMTVFTAALGQWHMPLFMMLAGASTRLALSHRSAGQYAKERVRRLLIPLVFGMVAIVPPQVYIERISAWSSPRMSPINFSGSYFQFYPHFFEGIYPRGNLSWHHLWFVAYLLTYSLALAGPLAWLARSERGRRVVTRFARMFAPGARVLLLGAPLVAIQAALGPRFPGSHALIDDWCNHAHYLLVFVYGFLLIDNEHLDAAVVRCRLSALALGTIFTAAFFLWQDRPALYSPAYFLRLLLWCGGEWCWLIALLGFARALVKRPSAWLSYAATVAYPFYILHQTVIVILAWLVLRWNWSIGSKFALVSTAAVVITVGLCEAARRTSPTRMLLGMARR